MSPNVHALFFFIPLNISCRFAVKNTRVSDTLKFSLFSLPAYLYLTDDVQCVQSEVF